MRLDKYVADCGVASRREAAQACRRGAVLCNGHPVLRPEQHVCPESDEIVYCGRVLCWSRYTYVWLNKPAGYVSATEDGHLPVVTQLLPEELQRRALFPCGRLDRDTLGLMLLTNDGPLSHSLLSPRHHVEKVYRFTAAFPLPPDAEERMAAGMTLDGEICKPASLTADSDRMGGRLVLTEGKYHQVKRMVEALGSRVLTLERVCFAGIPLDPALARGQWRYCTEEEIAILRAHAPQ